MTASRGAVFTATGPEKYLILAKQAALSLKKHNPGLAADLYTDREEVPSVFDQVHRVENSWLRSRIDVLRHSRFDRILMLDSDIHVLAPITDIFDVLDRFDIALAHDQERNGKLSFTFWRKELPPAFAQFNGGVIALRKSEKVDRFLLDWSAAVRDHGIGRDQPALREVLWDSDLRIATLPEEYNLMTFRVMHRWTHLHPAPRLLHAPVFHGEFERFQGSPDRVTERLGLRLSSGLPVMMAQDRALAREEGRPPRNPTAQENIRRGFWITVRLPRRLYTGMLRVVRRHAGRPSAARHPAGCKAEASAGSRRMPDQ